MAANRIRLFLRGDDAGLSVGTNQALEHAVRRGALRNVGIMAAAPAWEDAAQRFKDLPGLCLGLHVALNCEWNQPRWGPVAPPHLVPDLLEPDGTFTRTPNILHERHASVEQMLAEVEAGLARLRRAGLRIGYLDEHMGIGWVAGLRQRLDDLARREGLVTMAPLQPLKLPAGEESRLARLESALHQAPPGDYLLGFHPDAAASFRSTVHSEMNVPAIAAERDSDRLFLLDPELPRLARRLHVDLCTFADLASAS